MRPDGDDLAVVVQAYQFDLLDPNGVIVASLGAGVGGGFAQGGAFSSLAMYHNDPNTTDSSLAWTQNGSSGFETVRLQGPVVAGHSVNNRPEIDLYRQPSGITAVLIQSGQDDNLNVGAFVQLAYNPAVTSGSLLIGADQVQLTATQSGLNRGLVYGQAMFSAQSAVASVLLTTVSQIILTINLPNVPLAGVASVDVSATCMIACLIAGDAADAWIALDGVRVSTFMQYSSPAVGGQVTMHTRTIVALGVGTHTLTLVASVQTVNNGYRLFIGGYSELDAVLYR